MAFNKALILPVVHTLPANRAPEAHRRLAAGGLRGRIVLDFTVEAQ
jgi:NADPH:quinone reductase